MKKTIFSVLALAATMTASAQSEMIFDLGTKNTTFNLSNVSKITFSDDGNINVYNALGTADSYALDALKKITFKGDFTAIADTKTEPQAGLTFAYDGSRLTVNGLKTAATARICSTSGAMVAHQRVEDGESIEVGSLTKGVYVLTVDGKSFKFVK